MNVPATQDYQIRYLEVDNVTLVIKAVVVLTILSNQCISLLSSGR